MEPIYLVNKGDCFALACEGPDGALYLIEKEGKTLFTPKKRIEFNVIGWNSEKAAEIAKEYNEKFNDLRTDLRIDLSNL